MRRVAIATITLHLAACGPTDLVIGRGPHSLGFDGAGCATGAGGAAGFGQALTIEAWVRGDPDQDAEPGAIVSLGGAALWTSGTATGLGDASGLTTGGWSTRLGLRDGRRHHVAAVWEDHAGAVLFIDGGRSGAGSPLASFPPSVIGEIRLGCSGGALAGFDGVVDEVRVSSVARYVRNFYPPEVPFEADGATIALFHLDLGDGDIAADAAGRFDAVLDDGVSWVRGDLVGGAQVAD
jgi:hypothetical protein